MLTCDCLRPSFAADWGDYISLAERLREKAHEDGSDLILVDTGDRIEGSGLYDASEPKGKYTLKIVSEQDIDVLCTGNHELYHNRSANNEYQATVPNFKGNYLASNLDILDPETGERRPMAQRYRKFTTQNQGIRIMAFGFLFDFTMNSNNTFVQKVEDTVQEEWFKKAIQDREVDLFLVAGHASLRSPEFTRLFRAIRSQNWDTPIHFFGGHTHIRDYARYDSNAFAMESGRYMETIGFASIDGLAAGGKSTTIANAIPRSHNARYPRALTASPKFGRRYIDNNLFSFHRSTLESPVCTLVLVAFQDARDRLSRVQPCSDCLLYGRQGRVNLARSQGRWCNAHAWRYQCDHIACRLSWLLSDRSTAHLLWL